MAFVWTALDYEDEDGNEDKYHYNYEQLPESLLSEQCSSKKETILTRFCTTPWANSSILDEVGKC